MLQRPRNQAPRWLLPWLEITLPLYSLMGLLVYYQPDRFDVDLGDGWLEDVALWALRIVGGAFGGILVLFALLLVFFLLYSPVYLARNLGRAMARDAWIDRDDFYFYLRCLGLLGLLVLVTLWNPEAALVSFVLLAGFAPLLWRFLL